MSNRSKRSKDESNEQSKGENNNAQQVPNEKQVVELKAVDGQESAQNSLVQNEQEFVEAENNTAGEMQSNKSSNTPQVGDDIHVSLGVDNNEFDDEIDEFAGEPEYTSSESESEDSSDSDSDDSEVKVSRRWPRSESESDDEDSRVQHRVQEMVNRKMEAECEKLRREFERKYNVKRRCKHEKEKTGGRSRSRSRHRSRSQSKPTKSDKKGKNENTELNKNGKSVVTPVRSERKTMKGMNLGRSKLPSTNLFNEGAIVKSLSDTTIYVPGLNKRKPNNNRDNEINNVANFVERIRLEQDRSSNSRRSSDRDRGDDSRGNSGYVEASDEQRDDLPSTSNMDEAMKQAKKLIVEAEQFKAAIEAPSGKKLMSNAPLLGTAGGMTDDDFFHIICHVDRKLREKIEKGEFVYLEKLLPQGKYGRRNKDGTTKLELVHREGETFYQPAETPNRINNVRKWEQAFRIYAMIYCNANPERAGEIWQYTYIINTAAATYTWENVAEYDYNF